MCKIDGIFGLVVDYYVLINSILVHLLRFYIVSVCTVHQKIEMKKSDELCSFFLFYKKSSI